MSGFLLDTNVPSESWRAQSTANVAAWLKSQVKAARFISVVTVGELRKGAMLLPPSAKRTQIEYSMEVLIPAWFGRRVLSVTQAIAERWGCFEDRVRQPGSDIGPHCGYTSPAAQVAHDTPAKTRSN